MIFSHRFLFLLVACLVSGESLPASSADLTPRSHEYFLDGVSFKGIKFIHGKEIIIYAPPPNWACSGDSTAASLRPEGVSTVRAEITHKESTPPFPAWDQDGINALIKRAQALLPPQAQDVQIADVRKNPLLMGGHETALFVFTGTLLSQKYKFSVVLLPLEDEQFGFLVYSEAREYEAAAMAFMQSLYSIRWEKAVR